MLCNCIFSYLFCHEISNCIIYGYQYNLINNCNNKISNLEYLINEYTVKNNYLDNLINTYNNKINNIEYSLKEYESKIICIDNLINNYNKKINNIELSINNNYKEINELKKITKNNTDNYIYILELVNNKYYIGKTSNPKIRISQHISEKGSEWTKLYKPIKLIELIPNCVDFDEDKYTLTYMKTKGIDNVRGGSFSQIYIDESTIKIIKKMLNNEDNVCFNCNKQGHFINECPKIDKLNMKTEICFNCKETGHYTKDCKKIHNFKCEFCERTFETKNGAKYHASNYCKNAKKLKTIE
jgi:hypothetical protein